MEKNEMFHNKWKWVYAWIVYAQKIVFESIDADIEADKLKKKNTHRERKKETRFRMMKKAAFLSIVYDPPCNFIDVKSLSYNLCGRNNYHRWWSVDFRVDVCADMSAEIIFFGCYALH